MLRALTTGFTLVLLSACGPGDAYRDDSSDVNAFDPGTYIHLATGNTDIASLRTETSGRKRWPVEVLSIGHTNASYQNYGPEAYFHHGVDIRANADATVRASAGGKVIAVRNYGPKGPLYWEVAILDDDGYIWQYHHVDRAGIPNDVLRAFQSGGRVEEGAVIGRVQRWNAVAFGETFHHIHLNVIGKNGTILNPFAFLDPLGDTQRPEFEELGLLLNGRISNQKIAGDGFSVYAKVNDLVKHERFTVPPYRVSYKLNAGAEEVVWQFDTLPGKSSDTSLVHDFFVKSATCGNYTCRSFTIDIGFTPSGKRKFPAKSGANKIEVIAEDYEGNRESAILDFQYAGRVEAPDCEPSKDIFFALANETASNALTQPVDVFTSVAGDSEVTLCAGNATDCLGGRGQAYPAQKVYARDGRNYFKSSAVDANAKRYTAISRNADQCTYRQFEVVGN